jgi:hypothetical protein
VVGEMSLESLTALGVSGAEGMGAVAGLSVLKLACDAVSITAPTP